MTDDLFCQTCGEELKPGRPCERCAEFGATSAPQRFTPPVTIPNQVVEANVVARGQSETAHPPRNTTLNPCSACGQLVSRHARSCPHCGEPLTLVADRRYALLSTIGGIAFGAGIALVGAVYSAAAQDRIGHKYAAVYATVFIAAALGMFFGGILFLYARIRRRLEEGSGQ